MCKYIVNKVYALIRNNCCIYQCIEFLKVGVLLIHLNSLIPLAVRLFNKFKFL